MAGNSSEIGQYLGAEKCEAIKQYILFYRHSNIPAPEVQMRPPASPPINLHSK